MPRADPATASNATNPTRSIRWTAGRSAHSASVNGRRCRIVRYPDGSPFAGKFGCYVEGRFKGVAGTLETAKSRCRTISNPPTSARERVNLRTWQPH
jgi:hypothetical protein